MHYTNGGEQTTMKLNLGGTELHRVPIGQATEPGNSKFQSTAKVAGGYRIQTSDFSEAIDA